MTSLLVISLTLIRYFVTILYCTAQLNLTANSFFLLRLNALIWKLDGMECSRLLDLI